MAQFTAEGGYYYKVLSDARKIVFLYAGASALAGYETVNWGDRTLFDGSTPVSYTHLDVYKRQTFTRFSVRFTGR